MNMINWRKPQDLILITFTVAFLEKSLTAPFSYYWYQFLVLLVISIGFKFYDYRQGQKK